MEKLINNKSFINLKNDMNEVIDQFKSIEKDVNQSVYDKYQLYQYEQIIEGNDEDVLKKYETMYDKFAEIVINKNTAIQQSNDSINQINDMIEYIKKLTDTNNMNSIINKEMFNADEMIKCLNQIVDKILEKETTIFNRKEQEFEQQKQQRKQEFEEKQKDIKNMKRNIITLKKSYNNNKEKEIEKFFLNDTKIQQDKEIQENIMPSIDKLKEWSGKQKCSVMFDSKIDGDGKGVLENKVINKTNLYFISFDNQNNVFGGYMNELINQKQTSIKCPNSFVFSLIRNGKVKNMTYDVKNSVKQNVQFYLYSNSDILYQFGIGNGRSPDDIYISKIGYNNSRYNPYNYEYNGEQQPLVDGANFILKRILVLEMN